MRRQLVPALLMTITLTVLLGVVYPLATTVVARGLFGHRADGSFIKVGGKVVGSTLIGQKFVDSAGNADRRYFQPRPSAGGYDGLASGGSNVGPSNPKLIAPASGPDCFMVERKCSADTVPARVDAYRQFNGLAAATPVPVDAVTASASGLDPNITVANAQLQAARVAEVRHVGVNKVLDLVRARTQGRQWGFLGEKTLN